MATKWMEVQGQKRADLFDNSWKPNPGDKIVGRYIEYKTNVGSHGSNVYVIRLSDGTTKDIWGGTVLDDKMTSVAIGVPLAIQFLGLEKSTNGSYKNYRVFIPEAERAPVENDIPVIEEDDVNVADIPF